MSETSSIDVTAAAQSRPQNLKSDESKPLSVSARFGRLQFHTSGKFRVLQCADIQDVPKISADTIALIEASLDAVRPDLVVFSGNQIAGYEAVYSQTYRKRRWDMPHRQGPWGMRSASALAREEAALEATREHVRQSIAQCVQPLENRGIPWAVTYGNHDFQCGLDNAEMDAIYREFPGCLNPESTAARSDRPRTQPSSGLQDQLIFPCEPGTFALPVTDVERRRNVLGLVLLDSGDYSRTGGYGSPSDRALDFLAQVPELVAAQSMVFQHIPLPQYYSLLKEVSSTSARAIEGYRTFSGRNFVLDESQTLPGGYLGEGISCPDVDSGEFDVLRSSAGYFAVVSGHDHRNGFVGTVDGIMLAATPTCGFGSYGPAPAQRAVRLFEFDIRHPHQPRTQLLEFGELVGKPSSRKAYTFALNDTAKSPGQTVDLLHKPKFVERLLKRLGVGK